MASKRPRLSYRSVKRTLDVVVAVFVLVLGAPVACVVALCVRIIHGSPVIFSQVRPGKDGELFEMYKFRSMRTGDAPDAERLTSFGSLLRSTSLDELPSMVNVLSGDMSLVGPRPLLPRYLPLYSDRQMRRHEVRPGVTGLAQTNGRNLLDWEDRLELDVEYVDTASLVLDLKILGATIASVINRDGISMEGEATMSEFAGSGTKREGQ